MSLEVISSEDFLGIPRSAPWDFSQLRRLHEAIEAKAAAQEATGGLVCRAGCHHCCRRIPTLLPVEWAFLSEAGISGGATALESDLHPQEPLCSGLDASGLCTIYPLRPVTCRTHGLLLLSREGIDHCPWNFQDLEEVDEDLPFRLESLTESLVRVNLAFLAVSYPGRRAELAGCRVEFQRESGIG